MHATASGASCLSPDSGKQQYVHRQLASLARPTSSAISRYGTAVSTCCSVTMASPSISPATLLRPLASVRTSCSSITRSASADSSGAISSRTCRSLPDVFSVATSNTLDTTLNRARCPASHSTRARHTNACSGRNPPGNGTPSSMTGVSASASASFPVWAAMRGLDALRTALHTALCSTPAAVTVAECEARGRAAWRVLDGSALNSNRACSAVRHNGSLASMSSCAMSYRQGAQQHKTARRPRVRHRHK